jgi:acyl-CoA thioester hydrolase
VYSGVSSPHRIEIAPRWYELDPYRHVNHSVYVQYFEVARIELLDAIGFGIDKMADAGSSIVVTEIRTRFLASATLGDELVVETAVSQMRRASTVWQQRILRGDELIATQEVTAAVLSPSGRPARIDPGFGAAVEPYFVAET